MNNEEMEEIVSKLNQRINKNEPNFKLDNKTKEVFKNLNFFNKIIQKYPDKGEAIMTEIISNLYIRKYNQFEIIWDDNKKYLNGIFVILVGVVNVYIYNLQNKSKSNEIKLNVMIKKVKKNKENNVLPEGLNIPGIQTKNRNSKLEDLKPLKIDFVAKKGDSVGNNFLRDIYKINKYKNKYKNIDKNEEYKDNNDNKHFYKLESKTKSIVAFLSEEDYNIIFNKIITKERHERINFLHNIHYMPKDQDFIERFQNHITKKCFKNNTTIFKQNDDFQTFYIIISGSTRMQINFRRQFFCSLDFDVLIGNHINDRFTTSRLYEIIGNYKENENFIIVDLGEGEILGGIEFYKNIKKYIFTAQCITDVILYEININFFNIILNHWNFQRFFDKIEKQITYFKNRFLSINNFRIEKFKKDDYSSSQNKFILTYKRGHPISPEKEDYIKKYTNPFKFEKIFKSKKLKVNKARYINLKDFQKIKKRNESKKEDVFYKMPFITNVPKKIKSRKIQKSKTMMNIKFKQTNWTGEIKNIHEEKKDDKNNINVQENTEKSSKNKKILKHSNSALNINKNNKHIRKFNDRRLKSCKIQNNIKSRLNCNLFENKSIINSNYNNLTTKNISLLSTTKKKNKINSDTSVETINKNKSSGEIINIISKNYNIKNIKIRSKKFMSENLTDNSLKNFSNNFKISSSAQKDNFNYNRIFTPLNKENKNLSQPQINHISVMFPSGVREINNLKAARMNELLPRFISNSYIRNELKIKKIANINDYLARQNSSKLKIK